MYTEQMPDLNRLNKWPPRVRMAVQREVLQSLNLNETEKKIEWISARNDELADIIDHDPDMQVLLQQENWSAARDLILKKLSENGHLDIAA